MEFHTFTSLLMNFMRNCYRLKLPFRTVRRRLLIFQPQPILLNELTPTSAHSKATTPGVHPSPTTRAGARRPITTAISLHHPTPLVHLIVAAIMHHVPIWVAARFVGCRVTRPRSVHPSRWFRFSVFSQVLYNKVKILHSSVSKITLQCDSYIKSSHHIYIILFEISFVLIKQAKRGHRDLIYTYIRIQNGRMNTQ